MVLALDVFLRRRERRQRLQVERVVLAMARVELTPSSLVSRARCRARTRRCVRYLVAQRHPDRAMIAERRFEHVPAELHQRPPSARSTSGGTATCAIALDLDAHDSCQSREVRWRDVEHLDRFDRTRERAVRISGPSRARASRAGEDVIDRWAAGSRAPHRRVGPVS